MTLHRVCSWLEVTFWVFNTLFHEEYTAGLRVVKVYYLF